ncbi:formyl transferase-like protein [Rhizobium sp. PP-F2F-G48]|uniref:formyl transferase n=1 Tax=Rhizobium sp. PP-F2F-G48 TaxID=2135651 RepID=UPI0010522753|nr:formyl transferase [Rhizobium sp. PP-F2F-G48]TCM48733.1 formyl transferase-like protein [Rhizobium sp. PP-F2F-G48]
MSEGKRAGRVAVVTAGGRNPQILINALANRFSEVVVLQEPGEPKSVFVKRRARKLGWPVALGQLVTMVASKFGKRWTEGRARAILETYDVTDTPNADVQTIPIPSINTPDALRQATQLSPDVVFLVSCRMLSAKTLAAFTCPVINFHAGINPRYRGLMGGYWARVNRDEENFGATVHLVDAGVDTGGILYQARMTPAKADTMHTYPLLQTAAATGIAVQAVEDALADTLRPIAVSGPSRQWYHPPVWTWVWNGLTRGIW